MRVRAHRARCAPPGDGVAQMRVADPGASVLLRELSVPGYLDGFPVVVSRSGSALVVSKNTEWAERPSAGVARVLRDALSQRLDASRVLIAGERRIPDVDLTVEFLALDPQGGLLHLDAKWCFSCTAERGGRGGRTQLDVPMAAATPGAIAAATSEALARSPMRWPAKFRPNADLLPRTWHAAGANVAA